ncbi:MAG: hypothetical protein AAGB04_00715 [Pseudomonadota bacterium]
MIDMMIRSREHAVFQFLVGLLDEREARKQFRRLTRYEPNKLSTSRSIRSVLLFVMLEDVERENEDQHELAQALNDPEIDSVIVLLWSLDSPECAVRLLESGVSYVVSNVNITTDLADEDNPLRNVLLRGIATVQNDSPFDEYTEVRKEVGYVFISMQFTKDFVGESEEVYTQVLRPVLRKLNIKARVARDLRVNGSQDINREIFDAIASSDLVIFQVSRLSNYVAYELGIVDSLNRLEDKKMSLIVRRAGTPRETSLFRSRAYLTYCNLTDLTMQLFRWFGGRPAHREHSRYLK